tara:strand:- start:251 stop:523 length:273 start_codon:yes stop_codon:yes gene_type:complete
MNKLNNVSKYYLLMDYYLLSFMFNDYKNENRYSLIVKELNRRYNMIPCKCIQCDIDIDDAIAAFCEKCLKRGPKDKLKKIIRKEVASERR